MLNEKGRKTYIIVSFSCDRRLFEKQTQSYKRSNTHHKAISIQTEKATSLQGGLYCIKINPHSSKTQAND